MAKLASPPVETKTEVSAPEGVKTRPLRVLVAGGGIGGLAIGLACRRQGLGEALITNNCIHLGHLPLELGAGAYPSLV